MQKIVIIGCGIIGATLAYELSRVGRYQIIVYDTAQPAQAATGAALGVLMGIISQKVKGRAWQWRDYSIRYYHELIPELTRLTQIAIPFTQGIVKLLTADDDLTKWQRLVATRHQQQWQLELWSSDRIRTQLPQIALQLATTAVYSPQDLQVDPSALTTALVAAARANGVNFHFDRAIAALGAVSECGCDLMTADGRTIASDWTIVTAGLGATELLAQSASIEIAPVLGQAAQIRMERTLGLTDFQPVITHADVHIVPCGSSEYWVGATVEFPIDGTVIAQPDDLQQLYQRAYMLCPALATGEIVRTWAGLRPRPSDRPAPIIERVGTGRLVVAAGHYRNGILLAPATAQIVAQMLLE